MVGSSARNSGSFAVTTPSDQEIRMTRLFDAPRSLAFDAMTKPEHVKQWWGRLGEGYSVPVCEIDLRPGGKWRFVNRRPKGKAAFHGEYLEIAPRSRVVFSEIFEDYPDTVSVVTAELTEEGGKTRLVTTVRYPSLQVRDAVIASGMARGAGISYDRLEDLLVELAPSAAGASAGSAPKA
jgi:uncharacterized protein YndB with AHSA1/START domain